MRRSLAALGVGLIIGSSSGPAAGQAAAARDVLVFAAASLQTALDEVAPAAARATGVTMRMSYAASSALARQIENGAPADETA